MIVLLAHRYDRAARTLAERDAPRVRLLTSEDLGRPGWRLGPEPGDPGTAVIGGEVVAASAITRVISLMSHVSMHELFTFHPDDRAYAATEMSSFLLAWLAALPCPVVNRPAPGSLSGPGHTRERWLLFARARGIPTIALHRATSAETGPVEEGAAGTMLAVPVVGGRCAGAPSDAVRAHAEAFARASELDVLTLTFCLDEGEPRLAWVDTTLDLRLPEAAAALDAYVQKEGRP